MTSKWDFKGRSVDLTEKSKLVVIDFDNTCTSFSQGKTDVECSIVLHRILNSGLMKPYNTSNVTTSRPRVDGIAKRKSRLN